MITQQAGQRAEDKALLYLTQNGLKLVSRNFNCRLGEIDIIMRDKNYLVFIEVRSRNSTQFGGGMGSITYAKKQKIIKATSYYLLQNPSQNQYALRFDVVSIDGKSGTITWLKDAFGVDY